MPLYLYKCGACEHSFEELQKFTDRPLRRCPACHRLKVKRQIGLPNAICRGSENARTVGQLAEENTRRLIAEHGRERAEQLIDEKVYGQGGQKVKLPRGGRAVPEPTVNEVPWWRSGQVEGTGPRSETPIDPTTIQDPVKYVKTGAKD